MMALISDERRGRSLNEAPRARNRPIDTIAHAAAARAITGPRLALSPPDDATDDDESHRFWPTLRQHVVKDGLRGPRNSKEKDGP